MLERHFKTNQPNRKWVTDVTEFKVNDQKLYLSPILDLFNGEVVSYNLSRHPNFKQITDMLEGAFQKLPNKVDNLILHSDQGWQYQMKSYQNLLKAKGITQSMSRKATCLDNAVAENFFGLLKTELFYLEKFDSLDQLEKAIVEYIDYYNNRRIKLKLNGLSPVQYRTEVTVQPLDEDRLGYYSAASRQIVLSRSVLESGTAQETMDTIAHEAFHVQQAYVVENIDWDDAATQAAYYDQARRWLWNDQNGYVSGEEDILSYYFQPVEVDARAYAAEDTERLQGLIDKELQKET